MSGPPFYLPPPPPGYQLVYVPPNPHNTASMVTTAPSIPYPFPTPSSTPIGSHFTQTQNQPQPQRIHIPRRPNRHYELTMRQQPVQARMCGVGEKSDRRPVDPTPIVQLKVSDDHGDDITPVDSRYKSQVNGMTFMQNPYYFLFACLVSGESEDPNEDELHMEEDGKTRFLTGTPVSSLYHLKDLDNSDAAFFVFPDLGVRKEGRYRLKLTLFEIVGQEVFYCTTSYTAVFSVFSAKKFPGMKKATDLSKSFADQGLKIRVRKDGKQTPGRPPTGKRKSSAHESEAEVETPPKRSRGASMGPLHEMDARRQMIRSREQQYPPPGPPPNGYPSGYPAEYYAHGHRMAPPPPPSAYDPYRGSQQQHSGSYPSGYPPQYHYGSEPSRPVTYAGPSRQHHHHHHHSLPPPGYGPEYNQHGYGHPGYANVPPPSAGSPHERGSGGTVPWPQQDRRSGVSSTRHALSPRSRASPTPSTGSTARPGSSHRPQSRSGVTLPPINNLTAGAGSSSRSRSSIGSTAMFSPLMSREKLGSVRELDREREREGEREEFGSPSVSSTRMEKPGTTTGTSSRDSTPGTGTGSKTNRMGLGHLLD